MKPPKKIIKKNIHSKSAIIRHVAKKRAERFDSAIGVGELVSQKWLTKSVGIKLSVTNYRRKYFVANAINAYKLKKIISDWQIDRFYKFSVTILWLAHPNKKLVGATESVDAQLLKKVDEKKVLYK